MTRKLPAFFHRSSTRVLLSTLFFSTAVLPPTFASQIVQLPTLSDIREFKRQGKNLDAAIILQKVAQTCQPSGNQSQSKFVVTGRGGLPPTPTEALNTDAIAVDWVTLQPESEHKYNPASSTSPITHESKPIVEAQGWLIDRNGKVVLTASVPTATPHNSWQTLANCSS